MRGIRQGVAILLRPEPRRPDRPLALTEAVSSSIGFLPGFFAGGTLVRVLMEAWRG